MRIASRAYADLQVGDTAGLERLCTANDLVVFAHASGNLNPLHLPSRDSDEKAKDAVAPSMWIGSLFSALLGNRLPGVGTLYKAQSLRFHGRVRVGETVCISVTVKEKRADRVVVLDCRMSNEAGSLVAEGEAEVIAPETAVELDARDLPELLVNKHVHFDRLLRACADLPPLATAVVAPEEPNALGGALMAREKGLLNPICIGSEKKIRAVAAEMGADITGIPIHEEPDHGAASARAVAMVHEGRVRAIMKGHVHSDELLAHVAKREGGLRTNRRISHAFVMDVPGQDDLLIVSDAAINIAPDLEAKVDITQNAIDLARALGLEEPKVGVLSAVETVNPKIPSTLDAAIIAKMADRGQIRGGVVDGPLAMDNAMDVEAAKTKGITSLVAGHAEVLIVPNLESGNMLAKELTFVAHADAAGLVLGAKVPVMLTSRADDEKSRLVSCAVALLYEHWRAGGVSRLREMKDAAA